ncbi:MAG: riboflavin kinase, partial [Bacteroidales bacterium]|nr:riboflavin kinase [Bacteroidales bacterium]
MIFEGIVVEGNRIGRTIGFPTANIETEAPGALPSGVFACRVWLSAQTPSASSAQASAPARVSQPAGEVFCGMLNIGTRPTLS